MSAIVPVTGGQLQGAAAGEFWPGATDMRQFACLR